jgi:hypothetical protein
MLRTVPQCTVVIAASALLLWSGEAASEQQPTPARVRSIPYHSLSLRDNWLSRAVISHVGFALRARQHERFPWLKTANSRSIRQPPLGRRWHPHQVTKSRRRRDRAAVGAARRPSCGDSDTWNAQTRSR